MGFRKFFIILASSAALFILESCRPRERAVSAPRVNIILMSVDTLRADHLGCYGHKEETSPRLDEFVKNSVLFEKAISPSPLTTPAHISLFTATTPRVHEVYNIIGGTKNFRPLPAGIITATEILKANGYITIGLHGGGNVDGVTGLERGFDYYAHVKADKINQNLEEFIQEYKTQGNPFFIFLHHYLCHDPYIHGPSEFRYHFLKGRRDQLPFDLDEVEGQKSFAQKCAKFWENFDISDPEDREMLISLYDGGIFYSDHLFQGTLDILKNEGLYDNSFIVFLSDHGEEFYEHGGKLHLRLFIETLDVPLIIKFPDGKFNGIRIPEEVRTFDLFPTLFEYLKITPIPPSFQGISFLPLLSKEGVYSPLVMSFAPHARRLRFHDEGFVFSHQPLKKTKYWIFYKKADPLEQSNLADQRPELLNQMKSKSREIMQEQERIAALYKYKRRERPQIDEKVIEKLRALGYIK